MSMDINNVNANNTQISSPTNNQQNNQSVSSNSTRKQRLMNLITISSSPQNTINYHPDQLYELLDFFSEAPTLQEYIQNLQIAGTSQIRTQNGFNSTYVWFNGANFDPLALYQNQGYAPIYVSPKLVEYRRSLTNLESQQRLDLFAMLQNNNPMNTMRNDFVTRLSNLLPLFQNHPPTLNYTTYHHYELFWATMQSANIGNPGNAAFPHKIGLNQLMVDLSNGIPRTQQNYCVLIDSFGAADSPNYSPFISYVMQVYNQQVLFVTTDAGTIFDAFQAVNYTNAPFAGINEQDMARRIIAMTTPSDHKMFPLFRGSVMVTDTTAVVAPNSFDAAVGSIVPRYNFENHVLDFVANNYVQNSAGNHQLAGFSLNRLRQITSFISNCFVRRIRELYAISEFSPPPGIQLYQYCFFWCSPAAAQPINLQALNANWSQQFWPAFEFFSMITNKSLLMQQIDVTKSKRRILNTNDPAGMGILPREYYLIDNQKDGDRPRYPPAVLIPLSNGRAVQAYAPFAGLQIDGEQGATSTLSQTVATSGIAGPEYAMIPACVYLPYPLSTMHTQGDWSHYNLWSLEGVQLAPRPGQNEQSYLFHIGQIVPAPEQAIVFDNYSAASGLSFQ